MEGAMDLRQVEYVLAVVDRGSFTKAAAVDGGQPAVAVRRDPPARGRARRAAVPPARALGRADRRRARVRRARPASWPATATPCSSRSPACAACGPARSTSCRSRRWPPIRSAAWSGASARRIPGIVVRIAAPDDVGAVDAMVLDGRCELGLTELPPRRDELVAVVARTPGDRRGVPAPHPAPGAGPPAGREAARHAARDDAAGPVDPRPARPGARRRRASSRSSRSRRRSARRSRRWCSPARARRSFPPGSRSRSARRARSSPGSCRPSPARSASCTAPAPLTPAARAFVELARPKRTPLTRNREGREPSARTRGFTVVDSRTSQEETVRMSMFSRRDKTQMPTADEALPGRARAPVRACPSATSCSARRSSRRSPRASSRRCSAWAASGARSASSGRPKASTRPRSATRAASRRTRRTKRCAAGAPATTRSCSSCSTRPRRATTTCCASSGRTTTRPRACGRATTSARSTARRIYCFGAEQLEAAEKSRVMFQAQLTQAGLRRDHDRDRRGARRSSTPRTTTSSTSPRTRAATAAWAAPA